MIAKKFVSVFAATAGLAFVAAPAAAQVCAGFPITSGQAAVALTSGFITGGNSFGGEAGYNLPGNLTLMGGLQHNRSDVDGAPSVNSGGAGVAFESGALSALIPGASVCPVASINFSDLGDTGTFTVPVGLGIGTTLETGAATIMPYVTPQILFARVGEASRRDFQLGFGTNVSFGDRFYVGGSVNRMFIEGANSEFGLKVGVTF